MSATAFDTLLAKALALPKPARSQLADLLIASMDHDFQVSPIWQDEVHRRATEIDDGTLQTVAHEVVMRQARELVARGR